MKIKYLYLLLVCLTCPPLFANTAQDFGKWSLLCGEKGNCSLSQIVATDPDGKQVMLGANIIRRHSENLSVLLLRLPPSIFKKSGVGIKVDDHKPIQVPLSQCNTEACQSIIQIDEQLLSEMLTGQDVKIAVAIQEKKQLTLPLSLNGFKEGYAALLKSSK